MPVVVFKDKWKVDEDLIKELREKFLAEVEESQPDLYHPDDIQRVKENDWFLGRYILHQHRNINNALNMLRDSLKWRKEYQANTIKRADLPPEFFAARPTMIYNRDKHGYPVVIVRTKVHTKDEKLRKLQELYTIYFVEKAIRYDDWGVITVLFDCSGAALSNADLEMLRFIMNVFKKYYPWSLSYFAVYNMPWYLAGIWKVIKLWIPEQYLGKVKFVDQKTLHELVDPSQLPIALGGTCTKTYEPKEGVEEVPADDDEILPVAAVQC